MRTFFTSKSEIVEKYFTITSYLCIFFVIVSIAQALILALLNLFNFPLMVAALLISLIFTTIFSLSLRKDINLLPRLTIAPVLIITLVLSIFILFPHDSFGGRDESVFSNLAVYLAKNGSLNLPAYLNNLPDNYAEGVRARLPGYTVYLAIQNMFFGNQWLLRSDIVLVGLGLCSLFLVASILGGKIAGLITIVLYSSSMPFLWFSRETMTENLAFFLLWSLILFLFIFLKTKNFIYLTALFIGSWVLSLTRIEGFFIQGSIMLALILMLLFRKITSFKKIFFILLTFLFFVALSLFIIESLSFESYFKENIESTKSNILANISGQFQNKVDSIQAKKDIRLYERFPIFSFEMVGKYNFTILFISIIYVVTRTLFTRKMGMTGKVYLISLLVIMTPEFFKLYNPSVTLDQPWFYRRYVYALLPFGYLCLAILVVKLMNRKLSVFLFVLFFIINLLLSSEIIFLKNNWLLVNKLKTITKNISQNDYVIIRNWTLNHYYPGSFLIIQKGIRSSFSTEKISEYLPQQRIINGAPYNKLYLLSNKENESYPDFRVIEKDSIEVRYKQLQPSCELYKLGEYLRFYNVYDYSMILYSDAIKYCSQPENEIKEFKERLYLYELIYEK